MKEQATISIDLKKNRIRVHKAMLHKLGDPKYIQLLVNPESRAVAIRCVDVPLSGEPIHKVTEQKLRSDNSYEIYSRSFLLKLSELEPSIGTSGLFRMDGDVFPSKKMAVFYLRTLRRIDS